MNGNIMKKLAIMEILTITKWNMMNTKNLMTNKNTMKMETIKTIMKNHRIRMRVKEIITILFNDQYYIIINK